MTPPADAAGMADLIARLGLAEDHVVKDLLFELDNKKGPAEPLLKLMERRGMLTPFQTAKLTKGDEDGYFLGGYRILYRIAAGTFGKVYRGVDPRSGQVVAVKVLRKKHLDGEDRAHRVAQFEREGRIGLNLRHPNIVQILAVSQDPHTQAHYIVMEFVEGGTLRDILTIRKKIAVPDALRILEECADGLAHAYERGLTHRDIKPSNILVGTDGVAKLVDFGLAETKSLPSAATIVVGTYAKGGKGKDKEKEEDPAERTLDYAGIEKATNVKSGDIRSDIYFLGHALFEMIAGVPLMERTKNQRVALEKRRFELVEQALAKAAPDLALPADVRDLIARSVALEPHRRFQTPQQFLSAIKATRARHMPAPVEPAAKSGATAKPAAVAPLPDGRSLFLLEPHAKLRGVIEGKLAEHGFDVTAGSDPAEVLPAYERSPFHALVIDGGVTGPDGMAAYADVLAAATAAGRPFGGVILLNEGQDVSETLLPPDERTVVLVRPVTMKQVVRSLEDLVSAAGGEAG